MNIANASESVIDPLFNLMPVGFVLHHAILDAEGNPVDYRILAVNPAFEEMMGLSAEEIVGRTAREVWLPPDLGNCGNVVLTGQPSRFELPHAHLNRIFEVQAYRPQVGQLACIFRDNQYRSFFEGAQEGFFRTTPDGRLLNANPALAKMLGYEHAAFKNVPVGELWADPEDRLRFLRLIEEQESVHEHECRLRRYDRTVIPAAISGRKVKGPEGQTAFYEGFIVDITARKGMEEKLQASENKFKMAFMTGGDAASITTLEDGVILEVNDRFTDLFGYSRDEACGKTSNQLGWYANTDRDRLICELTARGHVDNMEFQVRKKCGELRSMLVSATPFESDGEKLLLSVVSDITERKRNEEERSKLEEQLQAAQKLESIGRMAGGIAHDFNNQLTVINGYGDLLFRALKSGDPAHEWVDEIRKAGERAVKLVRQLLAFSRKQVLEPQPVYVHSLVSENQSMLQRVIGEDIELVVESGQKEWSVLADPGQLHQVLMNLTVNARDAMPCGGTLTIRTANVEVDETYTALHPEIMPGPYVSLLVKDTGVGIAKEIQGRIFDPFFTTKAVGEGTGLGLSTVYGIVRQLSGSIAMYSEPGEGATFEIYLPRLEAEIVPVDPVAGGTASARGSETVLLVEDQDPVRHLMTIELQEHGYHVLQAGSGLDAYLLAQGHEGPIHLLLTDVVMPHMTGKELADRLRPVRKEMKVLYMSGYAPDVLAGRGLMEPGVAYIAKPFARGALAVKIRELLGSSRPAPAILVVDDDESVRGLFLQVLVQAGYEVVLAGDGSEALKKLRTREFDLLLTDLVMPEREGLELIMTLRKERPHLKVIAVSGAFGGAFLEAAKEMGAAQTLLKPVLPGRLVEAVQRTLA